MRDLYRTLDLRPGCALPVLKQAYRPRLVPDRREGVADDPTAAARLHRRMAQYDAATAFQHEHGCLPGAMPPLRLAEPAAGVRAPRAPAAGRKAKWSALPALARGMSRDEVRAMQGDPVNIHGDRWDDRAV